MTNKYSGEFPRKLSLDKLEAGVGQKLDIIVEHVGRLIFPLSELDPKVRVNSASINIFHSAAGHSLGSQTKWPANRERVATLRHRHSPFAEGSP